jgi:hypothetical protein
VDIHSPEADQLFAFLLLAGVLGMLTERTGHLAIIKADGKTHPIKAFFWHDPVIFLATLATSLGALLPIIITYGIGDTLSLLAELRHELPVWGWAGTLILAVHAFAPFMVAACLLVGRHRRQKQPRLGAYAR